MGTPDNSCDLVMKGGITSGVVYPHAVVELSRKYCFKNIGGTSAGAIAAVVTAAAEYGRGTGGFDKIAALPDQLATTLLQKFQPQPHLRPLFRVMLAVLSGGKAALPGALLMAYRGAAFVGILPGLLVLVLSVIVWTSWGFGLLGLAMMIAGAFLGSVLAALRQLSRDLPQADFGMCSGMTQPGASEPALTEWLADTIDVVAGRDPAQPLGVADLFDREEIVVKTVTTDISTHRPYTLPMENNLHFFSEAEFRRIFPTRIVDAMIRQSKRVQPGRDLHYFKMDNIPVVVLARMSLSFPGLISAVPLWRYDFTLPDAGNGRGLVRCLFSDGGLSSNFPVHFFDTFLPHRPTFGISLGERRAGGDRVTLPLQATHGQLLPTRDVTGLLGFVMALFDSAKDWQDSLQSILPGYRERIVTVNLSPDEGGLNLEMPASVIHDLTELGRLAGTEIVAKFDLDEHRWRRFLVEISAVDEMLRKFAEQYDKAPQPGGLAYPDLAVDYQPKSFRKLTNEQRRSLRERAEQIAAVGRILSSLPQIETFSDNMPTSRSRIRSVARMDD